MTTDTGATSNNHWSHKRQPLETVSVACGSTPVSSICRRCSSSISCRLWLQYLVSLVAPLQSPVSVIIAPVVSPVVRLVAPVFVACGFSSSIDRSTPVAVLVPVAPVVVVFVDSSGSSGCRVSIDSSGCRSTPIAVDQLQWLQWLLCRSTPVAVNRLQWLLIDSTGSTSGCRSTPVVAVLPRSSGCRSTPVAVV